MPTNKTLHRTRSWYAMVDLHQHDGCRPPDDTRPPVTFIWFNYTETKIIIFSSASDENVIKMTTFLFQCMTLCQDSHITRHRYHVAVMKQTMFGSTGEVGLTCPQSMYPLLMKLVSILSISLFPKPISFPCPYTSFERVTLAPTGNVSIWWRHHDIAIKLIEFLILPQDTAHSNQFGYREGRAHLWPVHLSMICCNIVVLRDQMCSSVVLTPRNASIRYDTRVYFINCSIYYPSRHWLFLYRWYQSMKCVVRWNGTHSQCFRVLRSVLKQMTYKFSLTYVISIPGNGVSVSELTKYIVWYPTKIPSSYTRPGILVDTK